MDHGWNWVNVHVTTSRRACPASFQMCSRAVSSRVKRPEPWTDCSPPRILGTIYCIFSLHRREVILEYIIPSLLSWKNQLLCRERKIGWFNVVEVSLLITLYHSMQCNLWSWNITLKEWKKGAYYSDRLGVCEWPLGLSFTYFPASVAEKRESRPPCFSPHFYVLVQPCLIVPVKGRGVLQAVVSNAWKIHGFRSLFGIGKAKGCNL
jgi:hypothetical protein